MSVKLNLARTAAEIENFFERQFPRHTKPGRVEAYVGYATPDGLVVRGRVLGPRDRGRPAAPDDSVWRNFRQMVLLFHTDEVAHVPVRSGVVETQSDEEGYFKLTVPHKGGSGLVQVDVTMGDAVYSCPVVVPDASATLGIISDIDDTMMQTGAHSLWTNLWTSLTGNALTRKVFPDALELMQVLHGEGRNPVFFVSSSPWNFYEFLRAVFARAGLPLGPMFLRDYGISKTQFITGTHGDHKSRAIDTILAAQPGLPFVLIGDTGQHDAHIYAEAAIRHPGRIAHVVLRHAADGVDVDDQVEVERLRSLAIPVTVSNDYAEAISELAALARRGITAAGS